jgi:uncharacterized membrane protein
MPDAKNFFTTADKEHITEAIREAEKATSGEIRVHLENNCPEDVLDRAAYLFDQLRINQTELRNGVLFYLAVKDRKFAIIGDVGINALVEEHFWEDIKLLMGEHFKLGEFVTGLQKGIQKAGTKLKKHFPVNTDDVNELSDEISFL